MPKVSIIVPICNVEKYLAECLESLLTQTLQDIEIICINDGSCDRSGDILNEYASRDSRIKAIHRPNYGYGATCNAGLDMAIADYIGIIESDDFADKNMFLDLYTIITDTNSDIVKTEWWEYTTKNKKIIKSERTTFMLSPGIISSIDDKKELLKIPPAIWAALYKKSFLNENNIRFLETPGASYQDRSFGFKTITLAKHIYITNNAYVYYRQDNLNQSVKRKDGGEFVFNEYAEIDKFLNKHPELKKAYKGCKLYKQYIIYLWNLKRLEHKHKKDIFYKFVKEFQTYYKNGELDEDAFEILSKSKIKKLINDPEKTWRKIQFKFIEISIKEFIKKFILIKFYHKRISIRILRRYFIKIG
ncbi:MAG: glycosyltransferase [Spirochaetaceae bacterium]|nr:glycosyltransferase [Spirochaetaceae bacterium]